ncbi:MAG: hypothetical protein JJ866_15905 [Roseibium sp.]|uniref:hypothetical protein n=1 Tax=Roseibium sp. TaxID=1936156 RepID=UPI001B23C044|nr:hypothetical protein [Roseibium sp.]MBO6893428.1 hypothetical protein [Roseibium sp.]MBO6930605.1 hypothetical protein [Roseibium sp.]
MSESTEFSRLQLRFLQVWHLAAMYDCIYILEFYCMDQFDHDRLTLLTDEERARVAEAAEADIYDEAIAQGYQPARTSHGVDPNGYLC